MVEWAAAAMQHNPKRSYSTLSAALIIALVALSSPLFVACAYDGGYGGVAATVATLGFAVAIGSRRWFHRR